MGLTDIVKSLVGRRSNAVLGAAVSVPLALGGCGYLATPSQPPRIENLEFPDGALNEGFATPGDVASGGEFATFEVTDPDSPNIYASARFFQADPLNPQDNNLVPADGNLQAKLTKLSQNGDRSNWRIDIYSPNAQGPQEGNYRLRIAATDGDATILNGILITYTPAILPLWPLQTGNAVQRDFPYNIVIHGGNGGNGNGGNGNGGNGPVSLGQNLAVYTNSFIGTPFPLNGATPDPNDQIGDCIPAVRMVVDPSITNRAINATYADGTLLPAGAFSITSPFAVNVGGLYQAEMSLDCSLLSKSAKIRFTGTDTANGNQDVYKDLFLNP